MKYTFETESPMCSLEEFAEKHRLEMVVSERLMDEWHKRNGSPRYMARFRNVEVKQGAFLASCYGDGNTHEAAIADYACRILGERLVVDAMKDTRREFSAPNEWKAPLKAAAKR